MVDVTICPFRDTVRIVADLSFVTLAGLLLKVIRVPSSPHDLPRNDYLVGWHSSAALVSSVTPASRRSATRGATW